ncbi:MAG: 5-bromo-4-chloroindolyl phosphate hydrolysis family protein [Lachnospiraceae bacterium]|nr:5-bromo-4-chloroindolyl phosphate hydrolysis family protein [Lachnospiraceae bacterium]
MNQNSSGLFVFWGMICTFILLFVIRSHVPSLANALFIIIGACMILLLLFVSIVMYFALRNPKTSNSQNDSDKIKPLMNNGRQSLIKLRSLSMEIKNSHVRKINNDICNIIERIFRTLKEHPEQIDSLRQFFHYYLPTLEKILIKYKSFETQGLPSAKITQSTITCLQDIKTAMEKLYNNLFEDDILDLTVEIEVLRQICKRDGLLTNEDFIFQNVKEK